jgi:spermidine/putrescine transport system substrate-binding protein
MKNSNFSKKISKAGLTRRQVGKGFAALGLGAAASPIVGRHASAADKPTIFTWAGWDGPELYESYVDKHGEAPAFTFFGDLSEAFVKMRSGYTPDVVCLGVGDIPKFYDAGLIDPIDPARLPDWDNFYEPLRSMETQWVDDELYWMPTMFGGTSVLYREDLVEVEEESWSLLWDERYKGKICPSDWSVEAILPIGVALGVTDPFAMTDDELVEVRKILEKQRELARFYWGDPSSMEQSLVSGEVVIAYAWSESGARTSGAPVPIRYADPKEGRIVTADGLAIVKGHQASLDQIYDYLAASTTASTGVYTLTEFGMINPNSKVLDMAPEEAIKALGADNISKTLSEGWFWGAMTPEDEEKYENMFLEVQAGF